MARIELAGIEKSYGTVAVVKKLDLDIADGELVVLVGPSGCGKSTTLRMIAGLESISAGELRIDGKRANETAPGDRDLAMVFQSYALYPHMTVAANIAFGLTVRKVPRAEIDTRVNEAAQMLGLEQLLARLPKELSGGQRQRVAMARAVVRRPKAFLFDEPLSNLDAKLRTEVRAQIAMLRRKFATTTVYVTHDQVEAMTLADRIVVLHDGVVQQVGAPLELYERPANQFVATFLGTPTMNVIAARHVAGAPASAARVGLRPHDAIARAGAGAAGALAVTVEHVERLGHEAFAYGKVDGDAFAARIDGAEPAVGSVAHVTLPTALHFFGANGARVS